jgi:hypothetical protein
MSDRPGYFKPNNYRGRRPGKFILPRDYCQGLNDAGQVITCPRSITPVIDNTEQSTNTFDDRSSLRDHRTFLGVFVGACSCGRAPVKKRRKKALKLNYSGAFTRYRYRNENFDKQGSIAPGAKLGVFKTFSNNQVSSTQNVLSTGTTGGSIDSVRCWDQVNPGPPYKVIGPFALIKAEIPSGKGVSGVLRRSRDFAPGNWWQYQGDFVDDGNWTSDSLSNYLPSNAGIPTIVGYDSLAWDKLKPKVSKANAAQFIYELRDLPRQLKTTADDLLSLWRQLGGQSDLSVIMNPSRISDSFLNEEFGWRPFISDLADMYNAWQNSYDYISELTRDNGSWRRKKAVLKSDRSVKLLHREYYPGIQPWGSNIQGLCETKVIDGIPCKGYFDLYETLDERVWAEGDFTYYRPEFDMNTPGAQSYMGAAQRLLTLYGVRINPTLIYKITPWTWTVDWFAGFGKFIQRLDDFVVDGIVSRGLCVMRSVTRSVVKQSHTFFESGQQTIIWERKFQTKARRVASSPYGFDVPWNSLSLRQAAILGAIGISHSNSGFISRGA